MKPRWPDTITWYRTAAVILLLALLMSWIEVPLHIEDFRLPRILAWVTLVILGTNLAVDWFKVGKKRREISKQIDRHYKISKQIENGKED